MLYLELMKRTYPANPTGLRKAAMFDLNMYLEKKSREINDALESLAWEKVSHAGRLLEAMKYSLMAGGKRIRPVLCLAAAEAVGCADYRAFLPAACAIEAVHTYSLIHDDLPAMDNDVLRRGMPTCHIRFDEATAILAGDALLTLAFDLLSSENALNAISAESRLHVIQIISAAAGCKGMVAGQALDMVSEGQELTLDKLKTLHGLKTGALIEAAVVSGAVLGGGKNKQIDELKQYGRCIGLAFQVTDDILNVEGDPELMGKSTGTDAKSNKSTFPSLMGVQASKDLTRELIQNALDFLSDFDAGALPLREIAKYIISRNR
jgi:geranylgeranyl diphosphate synthase, type II